jgi:hypothetical protein
MHGEKIKKIKIGIHNFLIGFGIPHLLRIKVSTIKRGYVHIERLL